MTTHHDLDRIKELSELELSNPEALSEEQIKEICQYWIEKNREISKSQQ